MEDRWVRMCHGEVRESSNYLGGEGIERMRATEPASKSSDVGQGKYLQGTVSTVARALLLWPCLPAN
jgi:hypothetical protein